MESHFLTDVGQVRSHNEDSGGIFYNKHEQILCVVADGMGGHKAGDVASQMATKVLQKLWKKQKKLSTPKAVENWLQAAIDEANEAIYQQSCKKEELHGMGTTLVAAVCTDTFFTIAHIGDSRAYMMKKGKLTRITEDHTLVNELVRSGEITEDDALFHPRKNVLIRALGTDEKVVSDFHTLEWEKDVCLILCSDGLTNKVEDHEIAAYFNRQQSLEKTSEQLIELANQRGGEDNISLLTIQKSPDREVGDSE